MSINYGACFYEPGEEAGTLKATWRSADLPDGEMGTGLAVGDPGEGTFAGSYRITYYAPDGSEDAEFDLYIQQTGKTYALTWSIGGEVKCQGTGIAAGGGIALAYMVPE